MKLQGKSAIVTGAASGIGKEIALLFAREGAKVAIADLVGKAANDAAAEIRKAGGQAMGVAMDVSSEEQVNAGVAAVAREFGVLKEKSMYGRKYMGIERTTFVIGADGKIAAVISGIQADEHPQASLTAVQKLN